MDKMKGLVYATLLLLGIYACSPKVLVKEEIKTATVIPEFIPLDSNLYSLIGDIQPFNSEIKIDTLDTNLFLLNLSLYTDFPSALPSFAFSIKYPKNQVNSLWSSRTWSSNSFINIPNYSRLQSDLSIVSGLSADNKNVLTLATFDDFKSKYTGIDILREADSLLFTFNFFKTSAPDAELLEFKVKILVDLRDEQFSKSIRESVQWRLDQEDNSAITKVDNSLLPVYSLWYPMDRNIPLENITHYFDSISSMGFRSVLFDDGWQNVVRFDVKPNGDWCEIRNIVWSR